ncbi:hypothetical protein B296_00032342 [Ensete ventricosum]|uniref:Uncharacterized protein n=1 Tax=Ensete ventricosum TaxID=4639 RepID=A0A426Z1K6_ENSVE|nr:hypothetical protein B296_00032342 [Ensete ventricosum]
MQWKLVENSLGVRRMNREARWEHAERLPKKNCKTHHKNTGGCRIAEGTSHAWKSEGNHFFEIPDDCTTQASGCTTQDGDCTTIA